VRGSTATDGSPTRVVSSRPDLPIATRPYEVQHGPADLHWAETLLSRANAHSFNETRGLYQRSAKLIEEAADLELLVRLAATPAPAA
jgi:hypothetical protein